MEKSDKEYCKKKSPEAIFRLDIILKPNDEGTSKLGVNLWTLFEVIFRLPPSPELYLLFLNFAHPFFYDEMDENYILTLNHYNTISSA